MHAPAKRRDLLRSWGRALILALPLLILGACEPVHSVEMLPEQAAEPRDHASVPEALFADGTSPGAGPHWFQQARSAARAGSYQQSMFYLNTAAAAGFAEFGALLGEPLFRPMYSAGRWQLITDRVAQNLRNSLEKTEPAPLVEEAQGTSLCGLQLAARARAKGDS